MLRFFKKIDLYLLQNYPNFWSTRIHKVLILWLIALILLCSLFMLQTVESYDKDTDDFVNPWLWLLVICGIIFWLVYLFRFNVFKSFGQRPIMDEWQNFVIIFTGIFLIVLISESMNFARYLKVRVTLPDSKTITAMNAINSWEAFRTGVRKESITLCKSSFENGVDFETQKRIYQEEYETAIELGDSCIQFEKLHMNDNSHYYQSYRYRNWERQTEEGDVPGLLTTAEIYAKLNKLKTRKDTVAFLNDVSDKIAGLASWGYTGKDLENNPFAFNYLSPYDYRQGELRSSENMAYTRALNTISNASDYRNYFYWNMWEYKFRMLFYTSFIITLLILIFKNMTRKTYLISIATAALMPLVGVVTILACGGFKSEDTVFGVMLFYYIVFACMSVAIAFSKKRNIFLGIALNLFTMSSPFLVLFFVAWADISDHSGRAENYPAAEFWSIGLFLLLLQPVFKFLYTRWYTLPEQ